MDFDRIHKVFTDYVNNFDMNDERISLKYYHTLKVSEVSYKIANLLGLSDEEKDLAKLIGYLHDIGRFEQVEKTNSFKDKNMDHADNGVRLLFEDGMIRKFIDDDKYDEIIKKAVRNHNKLEIEDLVDDNEKLFCNIIRDSDKIDIFRVRNIYYENELILKPSDEVLNSFENRVLVKLEDIKNKSDAILCNLAFIFDINYKESLIVLKELGYYRDLLNNIEVSNENIEIFNIIKEIVLSKLEV